MEGLELRILLLRPPAGIAGSTTLSLGTLLTWPCLLPAF